MNTSTEITGIETITSRYDNGMAQAGYVANQASSSDVFEQYHKQIADNTKRRHHNDLESFSTFLQAAGVQRRAEELYADPMAWDGMSYGLLRGFVAWLLQQGYSIGTTNVRLATIRQYCRLAGPIPEGAGIIDEDTYRMILTVKQEGGRKAKNIDKSRNTKRILGSKKASSTNISTAQALQLKKTTINLPSRRDRDKFLRTRDALMMGLFIEHALRCGEVVALNIESFDIVAGTVTFHREKTDQTEDEITTHHLKQHSRLAAEEYLKLLDMQGKIKGPLLEGYQGKRISTRAINARVGAIGMQLGISALSPHDLRHYWAFDAFRNGTPLDKVKSGGGWRSTAIVLRYAERAGVANEGVKITEE